MTAHISIDPGMIAEITGVVAVITIVLALVTSARVKALTRTFGIGSIYGFHRLLGMLAAAAVAVHIVSVLWQKVSNYQLLFIWSGTPASKSADVSTVALLALIGSAMWRQRRNYDRWRRWHLLLTALIVAGATLHIVLLNNMLKDSSWAFWFAVFGCVAIAAFINRWAWRPLASDAYTVFGVHSESPTVATVTLTPRSGRHRPNRRRVRFNPGQFGWLRLTRHPTIDHPYSFSSSAHDGRRVQVTVKRGGDFTEQLVHTRPGRAVWVDGPHGDFTPPDRAVGLVLIAAGVGITPMMSMLRTCADRRDRRPIRLIHAVDNPSEFVFHQEISRLAKVLNLEIVPLLTRAHPDWRGRVGHIDIPLLDRVLPGQPIRGSLEYFLCGPPSMVTDTTAVLTLAGVPRSRIHTERFLMPSPKRRTPTHARQEEPTPKGKLRAQHARATGGVSRRRLRRPRIDGRVGGRSDTAPFPVVRTDRR